MFDSDSVHVYSTVHFSKKGKGMSKTHNEIIYIYIYILYKIYNLLHIIRDIAISHLSNLIFVCCQRPGRTADLLLPGTRSQVSSILSHWPSLQD